MAQVPMRLRPLQWRNGWPVHRMAASLPGGPIDEGAQCVRASRAHVRLSPDKAVELGVPSGYVALRCDFHRI